MPGRKELMRNQACIKGSKFMHKFCQKYQPKRIEHVLSCKKPRHRTHVDIEKQQPMRVFRRESRKKRRTLIQNSVVNKIDDIYFVVWRNMCEMCIFQVVVQHYSFLGLLLSLTYSIEVKRGSTILSINDEKFPLEIDKNVCKEAQIATYKDVAQRHLFCTYPQENVYTCNYEIEGHKYTHVHKINILGVRPISLVNVNR